jgi:hypothetical protein
MLMQLHKQAPRHKQGDHHPKSDQSQDRKSQADAMSNIMKSKADADAEMIPNMKP